MSCSASRLPPRRRRCFAAPVKRLGCAIAVRNFNDPRPGGQRIDQRVGFCLVGGVEIGVPFVEQIDPGIGIVDDLLERLELALAEPPIPYSSTSGSCLSTRRA